MGRSFTITTQSGCSLAHLPSSGAGRGARVSEMSSTRRRHDRFSRQTPHHTAVLSRWMDGWMDESSPERRGSYMTSALERVGVMDKRTK